MEKLAFTIICLIVCISTFAQQKKEAIYVSVTSKQIDEKLCHTIEDIFHDQLQNYYDIRLVRESGIFSEEKRKELAYQESGAVILNEVKEFGNERGVGLLCVVSVETQQYNNQTEYYFRAKIFDVESGILKKTAIYPNIEDKAVFEIHNSRTLQMISSLLIARLGINIDDMKEQAALAKRRQNEEIKARTEYHKSVVRRANGKALAYSLIPGVGLMQKGRAGEGITYLLGDIAFVGGGVGMLAYANKQHDIMNDRNSNYEQYNTAKNNYNTAKVVSYCCFGAAAAIYVVNLVRSYIAEPKSGARLQWAVVPAINPTSYGYENSNISVNLALTYNF